MRVLPCILLAIASAPALAQDSDGGTLTWSDGVYGIALFVVALAILAFIGSRR